MNAARLYNADWIFEIASPSQLDAAALEIFHYQRENNPAYSEYLRETRRQSGSIQSVGQIPFLPVQFFKSRKILTGDAAPEIVFESSGTTGQIPSRHFVAESVLYERSFTKCFELFFGKPSDYCILALLPSYLERKNSSLIYMTEHLIRLSGHPLSGFFLNNHAELADRLSQLESEGKKTLLLGVSFALLDFAEKYPIKIHHTTIMETGGMKGRRKEITRHELHSILKKAFGVERICSEYGMTELLSQAYSMGEGKFNTPPWMKILIRDPYDPFEYLPTGATGGINIIDLANIHSCSFIQTDDLGKLNDVGTFEVIGRMDNAELRGCNLMLEG